MVLSAGVNVHFDPQSINKLGESFFIGNDETGQALCVAGGAFVGYC
jgi:hypothetical protein